MIRERYNTNTIFIVSYFLYDFYTNMIFSRWQNAIANLPQDTHNHCLVTLANGDLFYAGGWTSSISKSSYRYIKQDNQWEKKSDMKKARSGPGCGRVINPWTRKEEVVVAAGSGGGARLSSTEIYTVEDDTWKPGPTLPKALNSPTSLPYEDTFLLLGGNDGSSSTCMDSIYQVGT